MCSGKHRVGKVIGRGHSHAASRGQGRSWKKDMLPSNCLADSKRDTILERKEGVDRHRNIVIKTAGKGNVQYAAVDGSRYQ